MSKQKQPQKGESPIVRGSHPFVILKAFGEMDDKGKTVLKLEYGGRFVGEPDKGLSTLLIQLLREIVPKLRWSSQQAMQQDVAEFKKHISNWKSK